jgi:hypothetical protein
VFELAVTSYNCVEVFYPSNEGALSLKGNIFIFECTTYLVFACAKNNYLQCVTLLYCCSLFLQQHLLQLLLLSPNPLVCNIDIAAP